MPDPVDRDLLGDRLSERATLLRARAQELLRSISDTAGRIALTEDEVGRVHEEIARSGISTTADEAREHALRARRYADHERREQRRWSSLTDTPS
jgi:hypothetical protein